MYLQKEAYNMLKMLKVIHRILLIAIVAVIGMVSIAVSGNIGLQHAVSALDFVYNNNTVPDIKEIADLYSVEIVDVAQKAQDHLLTSEVAQQRIEEAENKIADIWTEYLKTEMTPDEKRLTDEIDKLRIASQEPLKQLKVALAAEHMEGLGEFNRTRLYPTVEPLSNKFTELIHLQLEVAKALYENSLARKATTDRINIMVILVAAILCIALAVLIARQINGELGDEPTEVAHRVERIAAGDLSERITIRHGFERSMLGAVERMRVSLNDIISKIRASSEQLGEDSGAMSDNGRKVMEAANIQNEATTAIAAAVEQMSVNVTHISDSAADARQNSKDSSSAVDRGIEVVQHSVQGMNGIMEITETTAKSIHILAEKSSEIGKIVNVIKDIADQTNLLALNAAIEAARAGEAGRGFAVVADEVRKLAERTTQSTSEIVSMVASIQDGTKNTLTNTTASQTQVANGVHLANDTGASMNEVKLKIDETLGAVNVITDALAEQSAASQQIGRDVERIAQMTDENASSVGKLNDTAEHIKTLAVALNKLVRHFQV